MKLQGDYDGDLDQTPLELSEKEERILRRFYDRSMLKKGWRIEWPDLENQMKHFVYHLHQIRNVEKTWKPRPLQAKDFNDRLKIVTSKSFAKVTSLH